MSAYSPATDEGAAIAAVVDRFPEHYRKKLREALTNIADVYRASGVSYEAAPAKSTATRMSVQARMIAALIDTRLKDNEQAREEALTVVVRFLAGFPVSAGERRRPFSVGSARRDKAEPGVRPRLYLVQP